MKREGCSDWGDDNGGWRKKPSANASDAQWADLFNWLDEFRATFPHLTMSQVVMDLFNGPEEYVDCLGSALRSNVQRFQHADIFEFLRACKSAQPQWENLRPRKMDEILQDRFYRYYELFSGLGCTCIWCDETLKVNVECSSGADKAMLQKALEEKVFKDTKGIIVSFYDYKPF